LLNTPSQETTDSVWETPAHASTGCAAASMQPAEADVDLSEIFSMDKIAYNARNLNYWCSLAAVHTLAHAHTGAIYC